MAGKSPFLQYLILAALAVSLVGCSSGGKKTDIAGGEYKRMMDLQRGKAQFASQEDAKLNAKANQEMTASEYEKLGDRYAAQGNSMMSLVQYQKALQTEPESIALHTKLGLLFLSKSLNGEAKKEFSLVLTKDPQNGTAHEGIGRTLLAEGDLAGAERSFQQALLYNPKLWHSHMLLGVIYDRQKQFDAAISQYSAALVLKPGSGMLMNNLAMSHYSKGEYQKAEETLNTAVQQEPSTKCWNNLGLVLGKLGKYDQAFEAFKNGSDEAGAYNNIGMIYMSEGKYKDALQAFQKAFALKPQYYSKAQENIKKAEAALKAQSKE